MHEGAVIQHAVNVVLAAIKQEKASRVTHVQLALGVSGHFTEEAVRQYFQALTLDTPIEGATLTLVWLPATYQCLTCQHRFESTSQMAICPLCGDMTLEISHQDECKVCTIDIVSSEENALQEPVDPSVDRTFAGTLKGDTQ